jgi:hypothetical protein
LYWDGLEVLPAVSKASMLKVCAPIGSKVKLAGLVQFANAPASSWHWYEATLPPPVSEPENTKVAIFKVVLEAGPELMVTVGGVRSTVQATVAGVLILPATSFAVTEKL